MPHPGRFTPGKETRHPFYSLDRCGNFRHRDSKSCIGLSRPRREAEHSPRFSAEVKNVFILLPAAEYLIFWPSRILYDFLCLQTKNCQLQFKILRNHDGTLAEFASVASLPPTFEFNIPLRVRWQIYVAWVIPIKHAVVLGWLQYCAASRGTLNWHCTYR